MNITSLEECMKYHLILMTGLMCLLGLGSACQTGSGGSSQLTQTGWSAQCGDSFISIVSSNETTSLQSKICSGSTITITLSTPAVCSGSSLNSTDCQTVKTAITSSNQHSGGNNIPIQLGDNTQCQLVCKTSV